MQSLWGIDLGGTKTEGVVLSGRDVSQPLARLRVDTGAEKGYAHIIRQITALIGRLQKETGLLPEKIGIGTPGVLDPSRNCSRTAIRFA
jgi:predicted NBD/HSP70 family sugar kinase